MNRKDLENVGNDGVQVYLFGLDDLAFVLGVVSNVFDEAFHFVDAGPHHLEVMVVGGFVHLPLSQVYQAGHGRQRRLEVVGRAVNKTVELFRSVVQLGILLFQLL